MPHNIVVIFTDDHAAWANGCCGNQEIRTPTIDYLARTGVLMENAFTPTPVCSPARASFFTGQLASQHGIHDYLNTWDPEINRKDWLGGRPTLAHILHKAGYTTALCGKWHLGRSFERQPGFDYWYEAGDTRVENETLLGPWPLAVPSLASYDRHAITDRAVQFLRSRTREVPFFLFIGYIATHSPWTDHPERIVSGYRGCRFDDIPRDSTYFFGRLAAESLMPTRHNPHEALAQYYASVTEIDEQVGRIVDEIDAQAIRQDTLIVYTSDHGLNMGHHGVWGKGNATKPYNMLEESIRVPLILNHPEKLVPSQRRSEMVNHCDLFETLLDYCFIDQPEALRGATARPGRSYLPLLTGGACPEWRSTIFGEYGTVRMARTERYKLLIRYPEEECELFDLKDDPREVTSVASRPRYLPVLTSMKTELEVYFKTHQDPIHSGIRAAELPSFNEEEVWRFPDHDSLWWEQS
ncbi:MAG: sulfatase-like hydrolase/transferase [Candidatus Saccharimonadales bacterium]